MAITRGNNRQQHAGFERNQQLYGDGQSDNPPGGWFGDGFGRAGESDGKRAAGAGLHGVDDDQLGGWQTLSTTNSPMTLVDTKFSDPFSAPVRFYRIQLGP